ncbi:MAG: 6,7-dimethyl-8-ribityllumazine synthase [Bordetella sp.]|nr:MAG: 6,7-dimethyl-8-ribityllumazine synthase [Bordetella sp.]
MDEIFKFLPNLNGEKLSIGIVCSRFYEEIALIQLNACKKELFSLGICEKNLTTIMVPGSLELAVMLSHMAKISKLNALIAIGAIIRGETYHFEIVCNETAAAISSITLETGISIANGVLTVNSYEQAVKRALKKGIDCARVAIEMANSIMELKNNSK